MMTVMTHPGRRRNAAQDDHVLLSALIATVKRSQQATLRSMIEMEILKGTIVGYELHETFELINGSNRNVVHDMHIKRTKTFQMWLDETMTTFASRQSRYYRPTAQMVAVGLADEQTAMRHTQEAIRRRRRRLPENLGAATTAGETLLTEARQQTGGRAPLPISRPEQRRDRNQERTQSTEQAEAPSAPPAVDTVLMTPQPEPQSAVMASRTHTEDQQAPVNEPQTTPVEPTPEQITDVPSQDDQDDLLDEQVPTSTPEPISTEPALPVTGISDLLSLAQNEEDRFEPFDPGTDEPVSTGRPNSPSPLSLDDLDKAADTEDPFDWSVQP